MAKIKTPPDKKSFILYNDQSDVVDLLSNEQAGILFKSLYKFSNGSSSEMPDLSTKIVFKSITSQIVRDTKKYIEKCKKNKENALIRWNKTHSDSNVCERMQPDANACERYANHADTDNETDTVFK